MDAAVHSTFKYRMIIENKFSHSFCGKIGLRTVTAASEPSEKSHIAPSGKKLRVQRTPANANLEVQRTINNANVALTSTRHERVPSDGRAFELFRD